MMTHSRALMGSTTLGVASLAMLFSPAALAAKAGPSAHPCEPGRYVLSTALTAGGTAPTGRLLEIGEGQASIVGVCTAVAPKILKGSKKGVTKVRVEWPVASCPGFLGNKVVLAGRIVDACTKFVGKLKAKRKAIANLRAALSECGDGNLDVGGGETCEPPNSNGCDATCRGPGELVRALGVTSYSVDVPTDGVQLSGPITVSLGGAEGDLGTITTAFDHDALVSEFTSPQGEHASMRLHVQDRDMSPPRQVRLTFTVDGRTLQIDLTGLATLTAGALHTATLTTTAGATGLPPSVGELGPGRNGVAAVLATIIDGQQAVGDADLQRWFDQTGLEDLAVRSWGAAALFATHFDLGFLFSIASHFDRGLSPAAVVRENLAVPQIHKNPLLCQGLSGLVGGPFEGVTGTICGLCGPSVGAAYASGGLGAVVAIPVCGGCAVALGASFAQFLNCARSEYYRTTAEDCRNFECNPQNGEQPQVDERTEHRCWCVCNDDRCNQACPLFAQALKPTFPDGSPRPALPAAGGACVNNDCVCTFEPDPYCKAMFQNYCGGGRRLSDRSLGYDCPRATCGDGRWDQACAASPSFAEKCDASGGDAGKRGTCAANQGCNANCACVDCTCGPNTPTPTCPKGDKGAYCGPGDCQCHQGCLENAHCPDGKTCQNGFCLGGGEIRFTLDWDGDTDVDLHVLTPLGNEIYYGNRSADGGTLDVDTCVSSCASGVENVFFQGAPAGQYEYWTVNYDGRNAVRFHVGVVTPGGEVVLKSEYLAASRRAESTHWKVQIGP